MTFQYTENGPQGLLNDKQVLVITSRGGDYSNPAYSAMDHQEPYIRTFLGFVGMDRVNFIHLQGVSRGDTQPLVKKAEMEISEYIKSMVVKIEEVTI
jgi:FMN-dependent NADH-azoreductase